MKIKIKVVPRASKNEVLGEPHGGVLKIKLTAAPVHGAANEALVKLLSAHFHKGLSPSSITILKGASSHTKLIEIV